MHARWHACGALVHACSTAACQCAHMWPAARQSKTWQALPTEQPPVVSLSARAQLRNACLAARSLHPGCAANACCMQHASPDAVSIFLVQQHMLPIASAAGCLILGTAASTAAATRSLPHHQPAATAAAVAADAAAPPAPPPPHLSRSSRTSPNKECTTCMATPATSDAAMLPVATYTPYSRP